MQRSGRSLWRKPIYSPAKNNFQSKVAGKKQYDKKVCFSSLQPGDRVLVHNLSERGGPGKLRSYWEQQIHVVVGQRGNLPVYEVRPEGQTGKPRVLHRNLLLPCTFLPIEPPRTSPPFDSRNSEYQSFQDSCWQASDLKIRRKWIRRRGWTLWFVASRVRDTFRTYRRPWPYCGRPARAGYKWSYDGRHLIMMKSQTNLCYLTLKLKTTSLLSRRRNKTIAALHVPDAHQMCCVMISWEILAITLTMPQVFKYQQPNLFLVKWCTVHVVRRGWLQRHIIMDHQACRIMGAHPVTFRSIHTLCLGTLWICSSVCSFQFAEDFAGRCQTWNFET